MLPHVICLYLNFNRIRYQSFCTVIICLIMYIFYLATMYHVTKGPGNIHVRTLLIISYRGVPRIWQGGGQEIFFLDLEICMSQSDMLRMAKPYALLRGFGGMLPREIFFKMEQFGAFWCIFGSDFVFKKFQNLPFLYRNLKKIGKYILIIVARICWGVQEHIYASCLRKN